VIVYLWTTVARETPVPYSSLGVSDNRERAQNAAEHYLRSGQAQLAFVETARTAMAACSFTPCYLRTGLGWRATADLSGEVTWARYTGPEVAAGLRSLPASAGAQPDHGKREAFALGGSARSRYARPARKGVSPVDDPRAYMQVAHGLREQIEDGRLKPGGPMPSISQICDESSRSRQTVGKALRFLEREGLIVRVRGLPYYVCDPPEAASKQDQSPGTVGASRAWPESTARYPDGKESPHAHG
jgi:DNA-binding transcriptional regulator YhcF (GntR family)